MVVRSINVAYAAVYFAMSIGVSASPARPPMVPRMPEIDLISVILCEKRLKDSIRLTLFLRKIPPSGGYTEGAGNSYSCNPYSGELLVIAHAEQERNDVCCLGIGMAIGHGEGDNKVQEAVQQVISSPLLETSINGAKRLLLYISMSMDIVTGDITELTDTITKAASPDVNFIFGSGFDENLDNALDVIVIASDFSDDDKPVQAEPQAETSVASEPGAPAEENKKPAQRNDWWDFLYKNDGANNN